MSKIILITGNTETLGYFSKELGVYFMQAGVEVFFWDMRRPVESIAAFEALPDKSDWVLVTFNFIGLNGEGQCGDGLSTIWEDSGIRLISIMVDAPVYYYRQLTKGYRNLSVICIDRKHEEYVRRWHPDIENVYFVPLCGNEPIDDLWLEPGICKEPLHIDRYSLLPLSERYIDILFIANYITQESIYASIEHAEPEYREFLHGICDMMIDDPSLDLGDTLYACLLREFPDEPDKAYPEAMYHMLYVDLYVRSHFRAHAVRTLVDAGMKVHCVGQDWDKLKCEHPENLRHTNVMMTSADCVRELMNARISLNVMPHFKAGAHDRIFSSMLAGCVALTDSSAYLDEILMPWTDHAPFETGNAESIADSVERLHADTELAQTIADNGRAKASSGFTWKSAAEKVISIL